MKDIREDIQELRARAYATKEPAGLRALAAEVRDNYYASQIGELTVAQFLNGANDLEAGIVRVRLTQEMVVERLMKEFEYDKPAAMAGASWIMHVKGAAYKAFDLWWYKGVIDETPVEGTSVRELVEKYGYNIATAIAVLDALLFEPSDTIPYAFSGEDVFVSAAAEI